ncbi:MAG: hypothetical protein QF797_11515 [Alphaproteobacteria bacterium]|mgnify:CR=1 FL=1|jgi:hypothetical protein|nr:hypothetical protein [Rhodospirillaceae bacterium]MDP6405825.1 hypothetical protein [Alphaproteobacteria bacterium]MDP6623472.1 hypothetical protein [Alphaproteobacteria bacterium]|tara:strand:- start:3719 stop:3973 length:255 start_codon:yes stop_codon:yes gene_type:complete
MVIFVTWLICSVVVFLILVRLREGRLHRHIRLGDLDWKGVAVLAAIVGLLPAIAFDLYRGRDVVVPPGVAEHPLEKEKADNGKQ